MLFVLYPTKDTFITNRIINENADAEGSNMGLAGAVMLYHFSGSNNLQQIDAIENSRILLEFDLTTLDNREDLGFTSPLSATYTLQLMDAPVNEFLPGGFGVEALRVSGTWAEGNGFDLQALTHLGAANWLSSSVGTLWTTPGGDFYPSPTAYQFFSNGTENLQLDVTGLVTSSLLNGDTSLSVCVKLTDAIEQGEADVDYKVFYSKDSPNDLFRPRLLAGVSSDVTIDQRSDIQAGATGSLIVVYGSGGSFTNIPGVASTSDCILVGLSSSIGYEQFASGSYVKTGFYSVPVEIPLTLEIANHLNTSGSLEFHDSWYRPSDNALIFESTFTMTSPARSGIALRNYKVTMPNLKPEYDSVETPMLRIYIQDETRNAAPAAIPTPSISAYVPGLKYEVRSADNRALIIPASDDTLVNSHSAGSFFWFPMTNLPAGRLYEFNFFSEEYGQTVKLNTRPFQFKVEVDVSRDGN